MKNRAKQLTLPTRYTRNSPTESFESWSYPVTWTDNLSVFSDYTGPKDVSKAHPCSWAKTYGSDYIGSIVQTNGPVTETWSGRVKAFSRDPTPGFGTVPSRQSGALSADALSKVYDQVRGQVDWAVNLAEARQTARAMLEYRDYLVPLADKLAAQGGRLVRFVRRFHPKQWGRRWLEYQYGWKPLVSDMYTTFKMMSDFASNHIVRAEGRSKQVRMGTLRLGSLSDSSGEQNIFWEMSERCKAVGVFKIPQTRLQSISNYTSLNPASLAWELLPGSFIADWVFDLGGYLRNLESACLFDTFLIDGGYTTLTYRVKMESTWSVDYSSGPLHMYGSGSSDFVACGKDRTVSNLFPSMPTVSLKLGTERLFSAASLLSLHVTKRDR